MKIVYISRSIIPSRTANSINVMKMCEAFSNLGHQVILLAPWTKKLEEKGVEDIFDYYGVKKNFELKKLFSPNIKYLKKRIYSLRCAQEVKRQKPDIVYGREDMFAFYLTQKNNYFTIFEKHRPLEKDRFNNYFFHKFMSENKNSAKLITNSDELKKIYLQSTTLKDENIIAAQNGTIQTPLESYPEIPLDNNKVHIGYVGSLFKGRGIDTIVELAKRLPQHHFHIIGGKEKDIAYWKEHANYDNLIFHGFIEPKNTYKYRNMCDILLAPYQTEKEGNKTVAYMSPIKLFEYMSTKKPIICSNFKVVKEVVDEECAILVDSKNVDAWEEAINILTHDKELSQKLANRAYEKFLQNHTWQARATKILEFIQNDIT